MIKIGNYNTLKISRIADFGAYLDAGNDVEILIPSRYIEGVPEVGQELSVFVYTDSEDRLIATTEKPLIQVGQFAFLECIDVNPKLGAFLEWVPSKDLLVPFSEQRERMAKGGIYLVYCYLDETTKRVVASSKVEKFLGNVFPDYRPHQIVEAMVYQRTDIGYKVIVNNLHAGMLYVDELIEHPEIGTTIKAYVKKVRDDGKLDITLKDTNAKRAQSTADRIMDLINQNNGFTYLNDKSSPEEIQSLLGCSKKDFKKAIGFLYKHGRIKPAQNGWKKS